MIWTILAFTAVSSFSFAASVVSFYPQGAVKKVSQVSVKFSADMVAMGDPRTKGEVFKMTCVTADRRSTTIANQTRWADSKNWIMDFSSPLPSGVKCSFDLNTQIKDLAGQPVTGLPSYSFSTSGPAILGVIPSYGKLEPDQYFVLETDGAIDLKSLKAHGYFEVQGFPDKVKMKVIQGKAREQVLRGTLKNNWQFQKYENLLRDSKKPFAKIQELNMLLVVGAERRFPESAKVVLHWPTGILSTSGVAVIEPQKYEFEVVPAFTANFSCDRSSVERACNPILPMNVVLSRNISLKSVAGARMKSKDGKVWIPRELDPKARGSGQSEDIYSLTFEPPFPDRTEFEIFLPKLKDDIGRPLQNQSKYPLKVATDEFVSLIKFPSHFGVLERKADPILPVSVRNVEKVLPGRQFSVDGKTVRLSNISEAKKVIDWHEALKKSSYEYEQRSVPMLNEGDGSAFSLPKPSGEREFELIGIPLKSPGFHVIEIASPKLGQALLGSGTMYVRTGALVTDLAVHFKKGKESSLVWVTQLSNAKSVSGADIVVMTRTGEVLAKGKTNAQGLMNFGLVKYPCDHTFGDPPPDYNSCSVYVFAQKGDEFSFVSSDWSQGIETYRFNLPYDDSSYQWGRLSAQTVMDRMLAKNGDQIQMKHILRERMQGGFKNLEPKRLPKRVLVVHRGTNKVYPLPFEYDAKSGSALTTFKIPEGAEDGRYTVYLSNKAETPKTQNADTDTNSDEFDWSAMETGHFFVADYRLPLMRTSLKIQGLPLVRPDALKVDLSASYLSGGPASGLKVKVRSSLQSGNFVPDIPGADEYQFFSVPLKAGVQKPDTQRDEDTYLKVIEAKLDKDGGALVNLPKLPTLNRQANLLVEMEYMDPNGEIKSSLAQAPVFPSQNIVGLRTESWYNEAGKTKASGVIVDMKGKPVAGHSYTVEAFQTEYVTHRKRLIGGFYSYDSKTIVKPLGVVCQGKSDGLGRFECSPKKLAAGRISLQAKVLDLKKNASYATVGVDVYEEGALTWWVPSDSDRIDLIPEKTNYEPGSRAKFIVRTPYPVANVLVTVEREGVLDSFVTEVKRDSPSIEVPIKGNYAPNVFVSAVLVRGRVGDPQPTALLDLARPVMKMGMAGVKVDWKAHQLLVTVTPEKKSFQPRQMIRAQVQVKSALTGKPVTGEVAVAVVDEALMRLKENTSWNLLSSMMGQRGLSVSTSSVQNQVIGKRHFGSKAKAPGGGGGEMDAGPREFFEPVLFWNPKLKLNDKGEASFQMKANDSMTSFRLVAVAQSGFQLFGEGKATVNVTKDLMLLSGLSPVMREEDQIINSFTVRNTTDKKMKIAVTTQSPQIQNFAKIPDFELAPFAAKTLLLPLQVPKGLRELTLVIDAKDTLGSSKDSVVSKVRVDAVFPERVLQATLVQLEKKNQIPVRQPTDAILGSGGLRFDVQASLLAGTAGVSNYMSDYPYNCMEQKVSKAIVSQNKQDLSSALNDLPAHLDSMGLIKFFPRSTCGDVLLSRYVMNILNENNITMDPLIKDQILAGLRSHFEGARCQNWWDRLMNDRYEVERSVLVLETLARFDKASVGDLARIKATPNLWKTETVLAWGQILNRLPQAPGRTEGLKSVENILRARVNFQGTVMNLQEPLNFEAKWMLFSSPDQEAAQILGLASSDDKWSADAGRVARGVLGRLKKGHWDTTTANAWSMTFLRKFSSKFEKEKPSGETKISSGDQKTEILWSKSPQGKKASLSWPKGSDKSNVNVEILHSGGGKPWMMLQTLSAIPLKKPMEFGYQVTKKMTAISRANKDRWSVGDVIDFEVVINAKADQTWVVIQDPIPAGASHLGTDLDGSSKILDRSATSKPAGQIENWPTEFTEKTFSHFVSYAAYLPRGTYKTNYRIRLNTAGTFQMPPTRVEAMYSPETFAEVPNRVVVVAP